MGALLTSVAWIFFNAGIASAYGKSCNAARSAANTVLASSASACMVVIARPVFNIFGKEESSAFDPATLMSCQLAGLVSISSSTCLVGLVPSVIIGGVASICFLISKRLINRLEIDDPLNIVSIHLVCGLWGLLAAGIF